MMPQYQQMVPPSGYYNAQFQPITLPPYFYTGAAGNSDLPYYNLVCVVLVLLYLSWSGGRGFLFCFLVCK